MRRTKAERLAAAEEHREEMEDRRNRSPYVQRDRMPVVIRPASLRRRAAGLRRKQGRR